MLELFPEGFEELDGQDGLELAAYTDAGGEERVWQAFGAGSSEEVEEDWADRWRRFHRPIQVGKIWVGPPWEDPPPDVCSVVIDPGRAFGTGAHATTRLCLELLQRLETDSVLDLGCGSGVLSIAAAKLGFGPVVAVDHEPQAVEATSANAAANGVEVEVRLADATYDPLPEAEIAVANITLSSVEEVGRRLRSRLLISSGYLVSEQPSLSGFRPLERLTEGGWAADLLSRDQ